MRTIRQGNRAAQVKLLQRLLNLDHGSKVLVEDGIFGPKTYQQVQALQKKKKLVPDGIVGPKTWGALNVTVDINHRITLYAQPTNMTCWSAAATMMTGINMSYGSGNATTGSSGGLNSSYNNVEAFARSHGFVMHPPMSWSIQGLVSLLRQGPLWVAGRQPLGAPSGTQSGHAVVVGAIWGNNTPEGTMLYIYDPWPPLVGSKYGVFYGERVASSPLMTTYILHR